MLERVALVCTSVMAEKTSEKVFTMSIMWAGVNESDFLNMCDCHCPVNESKTRKKQSRSRPQRVPLHVSTPPLESSPKAMSSVEMMNMAIPNLRRGDFNGGSRTRLLCACEFKPVCVPPTKEIEEIKKKN